MTVYIETAAFSLANLKGNRLEFQVDLFDEDTFSDDKLGQVKAHQKITEERNILPYKMIFGIACLAGS